MKSMQTLLFLAGLALLLSAPAQAQDKPKIERQFQSWLQNRLCGLKQRRLAVSKQNFNAAFKGVNIKWDLPDLVPPGTDAKPSRPQAQAEFRSPAGYFKRKQHCAGG